MNKHDKIIKDSAIEYVSGIEEKELIKRVVYNVYTWAVEGKDKTEIAKYLTLTKHEFDDLTQRYPVVLGAMVKGKEFANMLMSMSMYEMAMGKTTIKKQVPVKDVEYEDGKRKKEITKLIWVEEEIPASVRYNALKFLMENQVPDVYGKTVKEKDENEYAKAFTNMSDAEKKALVLIEKNEHVRTIKLERHQAEIVDTQDGNA